MSTIYQERPIAPLIEDAATSAYWAAAREGTLKLKQCKACGEPHFYPRALCPYCLGETEWLDAKGTGTIYSVSVTRKVGPVPYAIAYVRLDEGVTMLTNIVDCDLDALKIGARVKVCFKRAEGDNCLPMFTPA